MVKSLNILNENDTFIAMLMHDLKTPIYAGILAIKMLLEKEQNSFHSEILNELLNTANFMKNMTENTLVKYKITNETFVLMKKNCSINNIITEILEETSSLINEKNITINFNPKKDFNTELDYIEIKRVIQNILANAIEYAPKNSEISITLKTKNNKIYCAIKDLGKGISLKNPNDIFKKYLTIANKQKRLGTGLGLYIAKEIVKAHNGAISVKSIANTSTTITFSLPC